MTELSRRALLAAGLALPGLAQAATAAADPLALAKDEAHWRKVAALYDRPNGPIQLENGQFGAMSRPVRLAYEAKTRMINTETTIYTRAGALNDDLRAARAAAAKLLGVSPDEIVFSRGATESLQHLIGGYNRLKPGDAVLYADLDYDSMQTCMDNLQARRGVRVVKFNLPEPASRQGLIDAYDQALKANPDVRMMLLTHLSHRTGLVPPVREITALARARNVDVILDGGHALGQLDFSMADLGVDFAGLNLHKWIGSPLGVGLAYIRKGRIADIDCSIMEPPSDRIDARIHTGTLNYAAILSVPTAIETHEAIGVAPKAARLRHLRDLWVQPIRANPAYEILTPDDDALHAGITSFRLKGKGSTAQTLAVKKILLEKFNILTVERTGVAKGACIRVSPHFINTPADVQKLVEAMNQLPKLV
jgi:selenocysteine lyase/cysteine desulfurase